MSIVGRLIQPLQLHIENISTPVFLRPYVVEELSHPINVGRDFLGWYKGKLEFEGHVGFLEVGGQKVKLIAKQEELCHAGVTDCKLRRVMDMPGGSDYSSKKMVWRGEIHHLGDVTAGSEPIFSCQKRVIPAESGVFIPFRTNPGVGADWAQGQDLVGDHQVRESDKAMVLPGICKAIDGTPYCFVVNLGLHDTTIHPNAKLGTARAGGGNVRMSDPWTPCEQGKQGRRSTRNRRAG